MEFDEYQKKAAKYDLFEVSSDLKEVGFIEKVLGLTGEAGETAEEIKTGQYQTRIESRSRRS